MSIAALGVVGDSGTGLLETSSRPSGTREGAKSLKEWRERGSYKIKSWT